MTALPPSLHALVVGALAVSLLAAACGGESENARAIALYDTYRETEDTRNEAESRLRQAFTDISEAAAAEDRATVLRSARDGQAAAREIDRLLALEIGAAERLAELERFAEEAGKLEQGLRDSRESLGLFERQLAVALEDPFLEDEENAALISELALEGAELAVKGEEAVRRADRALAIALGIEPRLDQIFTSRTGTG